MDTSTRLAYKMSMHSDAVTLALEKILKSSAFSNSPTLSAFLSYVVKMTLEERSNEITAKSIAIRALGEPKSFDPSRSSKIRMLASRLRNALKAYYAEAGEDDDVVIELPKGGYVPLFAFGNGDGPSGRQDTPNPAAPPPGVFRIGVMPIECSGNEVPASLNKSLGEKLANALDLFEDLEVASYSMSESICGESGNILEVGRELQAQFALSCRVVSKAEELSVYVSLASCTTGRLFWAKEFRGGLSSGDTAGLEKKIVSTSAACIGGICGVLHSESPRPSNTDMSPAGAVYRAKYTYAEAYKLMPSAEVFENIAVNLETTLELAPKDSTLHAMLAASHLASLFLGYATDSKLMEVAKKHVSLALLADPNNQYARFAEGYLFAVRGYGDMAIKSYEASIARNPNDVLMVGLCGHGIALLGDFERGLALLEQGRELNPYYLKYNFYPVFLERVRHGDYETALEMAEHAYVPGVFLSPLLRCVALALLGRLEEAGVEYGNILTILPDFSDQSEFYVNGWVHPEDLLEKFRSALGAAASMYERKPRGAAKPEACG